MKKAMEERVEVLNREILLVRHGDCQEDKWGKEIFSPRGITQIRKLPKTIITLGKTPDCILYSPEKRTKATAEFIAGCWEDIELEECEHLRLGKNGEITIEEEIRTFTKMVEIIKNPERKHRVVLCVTHYDFIIKIQPFLQTTHPTLPFDVIRHDY